MSEGMIGRKVRAWTGFEGKVVKWEPLGAGMTDALVETPGGRLCWFASSDLKPTDGKGPLPSRKEARELADAIAERQLESIRKDLVRSIEKHERWQGMEFGKGMLGQAIDGALEDIRKRRKRRH